MLYAVESLKDPKVELQLTSNCLIQFLVDHFFLGGGAQFYFN